MPQENKTTMVGARVTPQIKEQIEDIAWRRRQRVSELLRDALMEVIAQEARCGQA